MSYQSIGDKDRLGDAWAYDSAQSVWRWALASTEGMSQFIEIEALVTPVMDEAAPTTTAASTPCRSDQERNPVSGRCRLISASGSSDSSPSVCAGNQIRSSATNRCRLVVAASSPSKLAVCASYQVRSLITNRCHLTSLTASNEASLKPCAANQERSSETNRCRKKAGGLDTVPVVDFGVTPTTAGRIVFNGWWIIGGVVVLGVGYATWEWRREIGYLGGKLNQIIPDKTPK